MEREIVYPAWERPGFLVIITLIGGYMNAYTYITRDGVLANMHTANMSHLGINLALGNWQIALTYFLPIASCIFGAAFSEAVKSQLSKSPLHGSRSPLCCGLYATVSSQYTRDTVRFLFYGFPALPVPHLPGGSPQYHDLYGEYTKRGTKAVSSFDREKRAIAENLPYLCKSDLFLCCRCGSRYPVFCAIWRKSSLAVQRCSGGFGLVDLEMRAKALRGITLHSAFLLHRIEIW